MNLSSLFAKIMGFVTIIITLALAPSINTANTAIANADNLSSMLGMATVVTFGAPLVILGLLVSGGMFALAGVKGQLGGAGMKDILAVIGSVIVVIVAMTLFLSVVSYTSTLIDASTGFAITIYSIIPLIIYLGIIVAAGWTQVSTYKRLTGGRRGRRSSSAI